MNKERIFIVPHDFTETADNALKQAIELSKLINSSIIVLHIIQKENVKGSENVKNVK